MLSYFYNKRSSLSGTSAAERRLCGAATAYALEQRRKQKEEEARQLAEAQAEAALRNAAEEALKVRNWLMGQAMRQAQQEGGAGDSTSDPKPPRRPPYPDPETADMTEAERLAEYKQSAAYQARQARYRQWEAQQAYLRYRQGEWADPQPMAQPKPAGSSESKPWWQRVWEWFRSPVGYGMTTGGLVGGLIGGVTGLAVGGPPLGAAGFVGGLALGAMIGATWGSAQEGYIRTVGELVWKNPWSSARPADFPSDPSGATDWLLRTMQKNAQGSIAETLRQTNREWGLLGRLVTVPNWIGLVQGGGPWDFKVEQIRSKEQGGWGFTNLTEAMNLAGLQVRRDTLANIHYGYVGRSLGYSRWFLEFGGGMAQIKSGNSKWNYWNSWFDDPVDNAAIRVGIDLYDQYTAQGKPLDENALHQVLQQYPIVLCTPGCQTP